MFAGTWWGCWPFPRGEGDPEHAETGPVEHRGPGVSIRGDMLLAANPGFAATHDLRT